MMSSTGAETHAAAFCPIASNIRHTRRFVKALSGPIMPIIPATPAGIDEAGRVIRTGGIVAFPTETVYGLGADATNGEAVARIFEAKGRPSFNPLIVHVPNLEVAETLGEFGPEARALASTFWPGPFTLWSGGNHPARSLISRQPGFRRLRCACRITPSPAIFSARPVARSQHRQQIAQVTSAPHPLGTSKMISTAESR